jgi:hypothetical protein
MLIKVNCSLTATFLQVAVKDAQRYATNRSTLGNNGFGGVKRDDWCMSLALNLQCVRSCSTHR